MGIKTLPNKSPNLKRSKIIYIITKIINKNTKTKKKIQRGRLQKCKISKSQPDIVVKISGYIIIIYIIFYILYCLVASLF